MATSWLMNALHQSNKPKNSIIEALKKQLGGSQPGRPREEVHASDITSPDFCPRKWALLDLKEAKSAPQFVATAMDVTFQMGLSTEALLMEEWAGQAAIGNWRCRRCLDSRTMCRKPGGHCKDGQAHWWQYRQLRIASPKYGISGGIDGLFDLGSPRLVMTEIKTLNPADFEKIVVPQPEHRLRTNLYLKIMAESDSPYKSLFNLQEARVLYISRGYGKMNASWKEILPFQEFVVLRNDLDLKYLLQRAVALKRFREQQQMPSGICATALDKIAKTCNVCQDCFSGNYPAVTQIEQLPV